MPKATAKICTYPACNRRAIAGTNRCKLHPKEKRESKERTEKKPDPFYKHKAWLRCRAATLRENPLCAMCGKPANTVHHIIEIKDGGEPYDPENLQSLCHSCHSSHHSRKRGRRK